MSSLLKKSPALLENTSILCQSKRFRGKVNIQKPRQPHFEKARMLEFTKPIFPSKYFNKPKIELCSNFEIKVKKEETENKYLQIVARECLNWFNHSRLVAILHTNPIASEDRFKAFVAFRKHNMHIKVYGKQTLRMALEDTKYEPILQHYVSHNMLLFSPEPTIKPMLTVLKKFPQLVLLSGVYEGKYLSRVELEKLSFIPNLAAAQAGLVQVLQGVGGGLVHNLSQCQNTLVQQLGERKKQLEEKS